MKFSERLEIFREVFSRKESYLIFLVPSLIFGYFMFYFTNLELIIGNMGKIYAISQIFIQIMLSLLFGLNIALLWNKLRVSSEFSSKEAHATTFASILSILVSGCPSCGITLASYIGLASFFSAFPLEGLELKILGLILLVYSNESLVRNMYVCKINDKIQKAVAEKGF